MQYGCTNPYRRQGDEPREPGGAGRTKGSEDRLCGEHHPERGQRVGGINQDPAATGRESALADGVVNQWDGRRGGQRQQQHAELRAEPEEIPAVRTQSDRGTNHSTIMASAEATGVLSTGSTAQRRSDSNVASTPTTNAWYATTDRPPVQQMTRTPPVARSFHAETVA